MVEPSGAAPALSVADLIVTQGRHGGGRLLVPGLTL